MTALVIAIHVIVCIALICIVLLQTGKGASLGAAFGGSTQTVFGATGSSGFFEKITTWVAVIFMATSLLLTYMSAHRGGETIMQQETAPQEMAAPMPAVDTDAWPEVEGTAPEAGALETAPTAPAEAVTQPAEPAAPVTEPNK